MEINTGASLTLVLEHTFRDNWPTLDLPHTEIRLQLYSGASVPVMGTTEVAVKSNCHPTLDSCNGGMTKPTGQELVKGIEWQEIFRLHSGSLSQVLEKHKAVFEPGLGTVTGYQAKIIVDPGATPKYYKARTVP